MLGSRLHPSLVDIEDSEQLIDDFENSMPRSELLNCADSSVLLVHEFDNCGIANAESTTSCRSFSVTKKSCATGYYRFTSIQSLILLIPFLVLVMKLVTILEHITILRNTALLVVMDMVISFNQLGIQSILDTEQSWDISLMVTTIVRTTTATQTLSSL